MTWGKWWWPLWFLLFLGPEVFALKTNWRNTLSAWVWNFEKFRPGQPIEQWSASHLLFIGSFAVLCFWLFGHFGLGWWRS